MSYRVGLTGGIACGKSTVAALFAARGILVTDADAVVAELTAAGGPALLLLRQRVGEWVLTADGTYNRAEVRRQIFQHPELRRQIEAVLHPLARRVIRRRLAAATSPYALAVVPLLFESRGWSGYFQRIVVVECTRANQLARARKRDGSEDAEHIINAQLAATERRRRADDIIDNNGDITQLTAAVEALHTRLLAAAAAAATF